MYYKENVHYYNVSIIFLNHNIIKIEELSEMREKLMSRVTTVVAQASKYRDTYSDYTHLWADDRHEFLSQFLLYGHVLTQVGYPSSYTVTNNASSSKVYNQK